MNTSSAPADKRRRARKRQKPSSDGPSTPPRMNHEGPSPGALRHFTGVLNGFELFCAYHLGLNEHGSPYEPSLDQIARRFNTDAGEIQEALARFNLDHSRIAASSFDLSMAKLDIEVAPAGIDRVELARTIFQELLEAGCGLDSMPGYLGLPSGDDSVKPVVTEVD